MKTCGKCEQELPLSDFYRNRTKIDGFQDSCRKCRASIDARSYQRHKPRVILQKKVRLRHHRRLVQEYKQTPCTDCNRSYPPEIMQFDHVKGVKVGDISSAKILTSSWARILKEIEKCEVVCPTCHALRTLHRRNSAVGSIPTTPTNIEGSDGN